jgi:hypothetical protein
MKKFFISTLIVFIGFGISSCDKDFEKTNINPVLPTEIDPLYMFSNAVLGTAPNSIRYEDAIVQQIVSPFTGVLQGGNHNVWFEANNTSSSYITLYSGPVKLLTAVIDQTKGDPARSNLYNMARIWRSYVFQLLVDTYGWVPYFESGKAYLDGIYLPKFDSDKVIYDDLLKEVSEAVVALNASGKVEIGEPLYNGNVVNWKKLGNSLLLRLAMRLSKVDESKAKEFITKAVNPSNGGLISSNADNALLRFNSTYVNPNTSIFHGTERAMYYVGKPFVDELKSKNDPRLPVIAVKYQNPANALEFVGTEDTNPANQNGIPIGYNEATIDTEPNFPGKIGAAWRYSQVSRRLVGKIDAPQFFITYSQTQLLLAEAAFRGWITGNVGSLYEAGVKGHMSQLSIFGTAATISDSNQNNYLTSNPYNPLTALNQINTQYWISSFLNASEAWANFRRTGFPQLIPNPYPQADPDVKGGFIRRLNYPAREKTVNVENHKAAVAGMGGDNMSTRVFWDK